MANKHKGEVDFKVGEEALSLRFSADAVCNLEDALGMGVNQVAELMGNPKTLRLSVIRAMFSVALKDQHPEFDEAKVRSVFKELDMRAAIDIVAEAFNRSFGDEAAGGTSAANPPAPGDPPSGTGPASTVTGAG